MNTKVKIGIAALGVVTLSIIVFLLTRKTASASSESQEDTPDGGASQPENTGSSTNTGARIEYGEWMPFGWVGGQNVKGANMLGLHLYKGVSDFKVGDEVQVQVLSGDTSYNGNHKIVLIGADDGSYKETMITIDVPKNGLGAEGQASGEVRKVKRHNSADGNGGVTQANTKSYINNYFG
jgi:hypothetical protein